MMAGDPQNRRPGRALARRWSRLAGALLVAGLVTTVVGAAPADAHRSGHHIVRLDGRLNITDIDPDDDDVCTVPFSRDGGLDPGKTLTIKFVSECDEVKATVQLVVTLGNPYNDTSGFVKVTETDCFVFCTTDQIGQKPFRAGLVDNFFQRSGPVTISDGDARVTFEFTYVISTA
jgi:hypothetical protein